MRKSVSPKVALASLTKREASAVEEIKQELAFADKYQAELRDILWHCRQLAKAQVELQVILGKVTPEALLAERLREAENILFETAFNAVY